MSLVTRCTSCGTLFKVVADQLKISDGWVRCGQCATVFDAQAQLVQTAGQTVGQTAGLTPQIEPASPSPSLPQAAAKPATDAQATAVTTHAPSLKAESAPPSEGDIASDMQAFRDSKWQGSGMLGLYTGKQAQVASQNAITSVASTQTLNEPASSPEQRQNASSLIDEPSHSLPSDEPISASPESVSLDAPLPDAQLASTEQTAQIAEPAADRDGSVAAPSFVVQAQRAERWRSPWMRLGLGIFGLILLCVLALQIAHHDKDRIAAHWPQAKPWLDQLCVATGCKVQEIRSIEAIAVDASSFNRINKNNPQLEAITQSYSLAVTLKNISTLPVALPHVELSLQDAQDQTVLRRVLSPADLGSSLNRLAPSREMPGNVTLQIDVAQLAGSRIAGYRVLAFYP